MKRKILKSTSYFVLGALGFNGNLYADGQSSFDALLSKYNTSEVTPEVKSISHLRKKRDAGHKKDALKIVEESREPASVTNPEVVGKPEVVHNYGLSGNWGGARDQLSDKGYEFEFVYKGEWASSWNKSLGNKGGYLDNLDVRAKVDGEKAFGAKGLRLFMDVLGNHGFKTSQYVGDAQGTSNIETPYNTAKLYELYAEQSLWEGKASVLLGLHDFNTEFYALDSSGIFRNSSFGVGKELAQSGANGPSIFPETSAALRVRVNPTPDFYLQTAVFDGVPGNPPDHYGTQFSLKSSDGLLLVQEAAFTHANTEGSSLSASKYAMGVWSYTNAFDKANGSGKTGNYGMYFLVDQYLSTGSSVFLRQGWAPGDLDGKPYSSCTSFGFNFRGIMPKRDQDHLGVGATMAVTDKSARKSGLSNQETTLEVVYRAEISTGVAMIPDYQYVVNPSAKSGQGNSNAVALRFELSL